MSVRKEIRRRKDGTDHVLFLVDIKLRLPDGEVVRVRKVSPVPTLRAARAFERQLREALLADNPDHPDPPAPAPAPPPAPPIPTLAEFVPEFMRFQASPAAGRRGANKPGELREKQRLLDNHLLPAFGHLPLDAIQPRLIDAYVAAKAAPPGQPHRSRRALGHPLAPATLANHLILLRRILAVALRWGILPKIPPITVPRPDNHRLDFLTFDEAARLVDAADPTWQPLLLLALRTGLRLGELRALRWRDLHLDRAHLRVEQSLTKAGFGTPKSGKPRTVELAPDALHRLRHHPRTPSPHDLVFCRPDGTPLTEQQVYRIVRQAARRAGIHRHVHPHLLRHTFASHCVLRGIPLLAVKEWLGHSSLTVTERYAHLSPSDNATLLARLL